MMTPSTPFRPMTPFGPFVVSTAPARGSATAEVLEVGASLPSERAASASMRRAMAAGRGDDRAMAELLRELEPRVDRVVRAILGRLHHEVEDVVQQALFGIVRALPAFRGECEPVGFASRVAARTAIAAARKTRAARARVEDGVDVDSLSASGGAPQADAERARRIALLREAMHQIPPEQAETLALRIMLGWSLAEVAEATGVPLNTVRSRIRLAKIALRSVIDGDPAAHEALAD